MNALLLLLLSKYNFSPAALLALKAFVFLPKLCTKCRCCSLVWFQSSSFCQIARLPYHKETPPMKKDFLSTDTTVKYSTTLFNSAFFRVSSGTLEIWRCMKYTSGWWWFEKPLLREFFPLFYREQCKPPRRVSELSKTEFSIENGWRLFLTLLLSSFSPLQERKAFGRDLTRKIENRSCLVTKLNLERKIR